MDDPGFLFLFNAILLNADDHPFRQGRLVCQALKRGHISVDTAEKLRSEHFSMRFRPGAWERAYNASQLAAEPDLDEELDRQQIEEMLSPPDPSDQDPMDQCGAYGGRS